MTLKTGVHLGSYEIRGPVGAGGMGEVYRAWDDRLGREVAVKVLPESVAMDPDRLRRFDHEARAAGALNHPNVLAVYDVGSHGSVPYIVSELLEGETLRGRIRAGGLTPRKAVEHAIQIARGLAAAHQRGIVHRDLKPENIFVARDGQVKILDFGLAKLHVEEASDPEHETATHTSPGAIMGTVPYMSPEQVRGLPADARSDIFALGSVLYEMLGRRKAFVGETDSEIEAAILREEPPELTTLDGRIPGALDRIVRRCLEKRPEDRFETARDVAFALETVATSGETKPISNKEQQRGRPAALALLAALVVGLLGGAALVAALRRPVPPPSYTQLTFRRGAILSARFSHDGQTVVYSAAWNGQPAQVYATRIGTQESRPLGLEGMVLSVSSQDEVAVKLGRFLGRRSWGKDDRGTLARVSLSGGAPRELLEDVPAADWDPEGRDLAVLHEGRLEYPIGHVVYAPDGQIYSVRALPGGRFAILEDEAVEKGGTWHFAVSLIDRAGRRTVLSPGWANWWDVSWSQATQEVFFAASRGDELGLRSVNLAGRERLVARIPGDFALHDVDPHGRLLLERRVSRYSALCLPPGESRERDLSWLDATGAVDLSADGRQLLLIEYGGSPTAQSLYLRKTDGSPAVRLGDDNGLALSPDGRWVLALPGQEADPDHVVLVPTGAGERRELRDGSLHSFSEGLAWFPDGKRIVVTAEEKGQPSRLFVWDIQMSAPPRPLSPDGSFGAPVVAPDGRSVAVTSASGLSLCPADGGAARSVRGGSPNDAPLRWSADGRWLFVRRGSRLPRGHGPSTWIDRIEIPTGTRLPWRELTPADPTGVLDVESVHITPDGNSYAYSLASSNGSLYLAEGLR
ncbi:MAG: protein kinase [Vicinamibacteria bacterium]